jgi:DNA-binding transcriptional ArsR family regulator
MTKITLDKETFKALASDTRLDILKTLDGKKLGLNDIVKVTNLNKATLHEHLSKLNQAGLVKKKEREGHKWVYYSLTWKGESLLHPENTKIVVLFTVTFLALWAGIVQVALYVKGTIIQVGQNVLYSTEAGGDSIKNCVNESAVPALDSIPENSRLFIESGDGGINLLYQNPIFLYIAIICFILFITICCVAVWKMWKNKTQKL